MATHSSILAWRIPRAEEPGGLQSTELENFSESVGGGRGRGAAGPGRRGLSLLWQRRRRGRANTQRAHSLPGAASVLRAKEPLMDRGGWQATVHSVTKSQTQLKRLSTHTQN